MMRGSLIGGFDPGKKGAFVALDSRDGSIKNICRVPLIKHVQNHRKPKKPTVSFEIDWEGLAEDWGAIIVRCKRIYIENIWGASPAGKGRKDGGASQFKMGYAAGVPYGLILAENIPTHFVTPQVWKKLMNYPPKPIDPKTGKPVESWKAPSFDLARSLFPDSVKEFERVTVDEGVAEAALIAYTGWKFLEAEHVGNN